MKRDSNSVSPQNYVSLILNNNVRLENVTVDLIEAIEGLKAFEDRLKHKTVWTIPFVNHSELANILSRLNELGFLFAAGSYGWPPAEIFAGLLEKKRLKENFKEITWLGKDRWVIRER